jgi:hypothetical protein
MRPCSLRGAVAQSGAILHVITLVSAPPFIPWFPFSTCFLPPPRDVAESESPAAAPYASEAGADIEPHTLVWRPRSHGFGNSCRPSPAIEQAKQIVGNEAGSRGVDMTITVSALAMGEETLRHDQVECVPGARHGDIKKTPLLLNFGV